MTVWQFSLNSDISYHVKWWSQRYNAETVQLSSKAFFFKLEQVFKNTIRDNYAWYAIMRCHKAARKQIGTGLQSYFRECDSPPHKLHRENDPAFSVAKSDNTCMKWLTSKAWIGWGLQYLGMKMLQNAAKCNMQHLWFFFSTLLTNTVREVSGVCRKVDWNWRHLQWVEPYVLRSQTPSAKYDRKAHNHTSFFYLSQRISQQSRAVTSKAGKSDISCGMISPA